MTTIVNNQTILDFESRLFKVFVLPGIAIEVILLFLFCVPTGFNINLLSGPIGGPGGIAASITMTMYYLLLTVYLLVAGIYSVILLYRYYRRRETFITSARRFLMFSCVWIVIMDVMIVLGFVDFFRWDLNSIMNLPVVFSLVAFAVLMTGVFFYWIIRIYKHLGIKVISKAGIKSALKSALIYIILILLIFIFPCVFLILL